MRSKLNDELSALAVAAPEVVSRRLYYFANSSGRWSARDRREAMRMGSEKFDAFTASWMMMCQEAWKVQFKQWETALGLMATGTVPSALSSPWPDPSAVFTAGLAPVRRRAQANVRRMRKRKA